VITSVAAPSFGPGQRQTTAPDVELLTKLSSLHVSLERYRKETASTGERLRRQRHQATRVEALLQADSAALEALRAAPEPDRVTLEILDEAVAGGQRAYDAATRGIACSNDTLGPELVRTMTAIAAAEREALELRRTLSPVAVRILDVLLRKRTLPLVSYVSGRACAECHLSLPTALAGAVRKTGGLHWCPHCKRVLLERPDDASAAGTSR
jgi:predicted  nucleic acid-binding Zn-ribbon protein